MKYRLDILGTTDLDVYTVLFTPDIQLEKWSKRLNASGQMLFSIASNNSKATDETLMLYRRVRLYRLTDSGYSPLWFGYIQEKNENSGRIEIICDGMLGFFSKRVVSTSNRALTGGGSDDAMELLTVDANAAAIGITEGEGGVTNVASVTTQGRIDILSAWTLLAQAHFADFEISDLGVFNFVPSLGSDKTGSIHLIYRVDGQPGTNLNSAQIGESGKNMSNRIYAYSNAPGVGDYTYIDSDSVDLYGTLEEVKQFNEAQTIDTLTSMATAYGQQRSMPLPDYQVSPMLAKRRLNILSGSRNLKGLQFGDVSLGDLVQTTRITANASETVAKRIAEIEVQVDQDANETMNLTLSQEGVFITAAYLDSNRIDDLTRRIKQLEQVV